MDAEQARVPKKILVATTRVTIEESSLNQSKSSNLPYQ